MRFSRFAFAAAVFAIGAVTKQNGFALATDDVSSPTPVTYTVPDGAEDFQFEAEVNRMMDIVINSLYQNKDVFLRELISNASDAIDKVRFLALTNAKMLEGKSELEIRVEYDPEAHTLTVRDSGIGMTHDDLVQNLGTVARSGTTKFLEALQEQDKNDVGSMIGKFGVGFYSSFLVSERVTVASKHPDSDTQYVWESMNGENKFHIFPDPRGNTLGRGTEIVLHLKEDSNEYADGKRLKNLIAHYSEFVTHPIHLRVATTMEVESEEEADQSEDEKDESTDDSESEETKTEKPKKTETVTTYDWEEINSSVAIWTRDKDEVTPEEYQAFWKVVSKEQHTKAIRWNHFFAEGNINFKSLLYLPEETPDSYRFGNIDKVEGGLKLYVRKVLISDEFDLMPRYLGFVRGVVDSDDLPLNVNRETLQETKIIKIIKKKLVRKVIDMIRAFANEPLPDPEEKEVEVDADGNVIETEKPEPKEHPYLVWYKKFNANLKMGVIEDDANRAKLSKLLRFQTSKSNGEWVSLDHYISGMKDWQKEIYFLAGASLEEIEKSPFLERFNEKEIDVLFLTDAIDEYMLQQIRDYSGKRFSAISSENVKIDDEDADLVKRREKAYKAKFKPLTKWLKKLYGSNVMRVAISKRLGKQAAIISSSEYGHSANMDRIMRAQAYQSGNDQMMRAMKVLEINPRHPFVISLLEGSPPEKEEEGADPFVVPLEMEDAAWLLLDLASLNGGFPVIDMEAHARRMSHYLQASLKVNSLNLEPEIDPPIEEEEAPDADTPDFDMDGLNQADFDMDNLDLD